MRGHARSCELRYKCDRGAGGVLVLLTILNLILLTILAEDRAIRGDAGSYTLRAYQHRSSQFTAFQGLTVLPWDDLLYFRRRR